MNIEARFSGTKPQEIDNIERLKLTIGEFEIELTPAPGGGVHVRLDGPLGAQLTVVPFASNTLRLYPTA